MEMAAGLLRCRSAGVKDLRALVRRQTRNFKFFEGRRWHRGNQCPVRDGLGSDFSGFADLSVSGIMLELQSEQHQGHAIEFDIQMPPKIRIVEMLAREFPGRNG